MARARPMGHATLLRPLLGVRRAELLEYLDAIGQPYRVDRSNADRRYTRNRLRHELLPRLQRQYNPEVVDALLRLGGLADEAQAVVDALVEEQFERCVTIASPDEARIDVNRLAVRPPYLVRELLSAVWRRQRWPMQSMGMRQWDELCAMALAGADCKQAAARGTTAPTKHIFPGGVTVEIIGREMRIGMVRAKRTV